MIKGSLDKTLTSNKLYNMRNKFLLISAICLVVILAGCGVQNGTDNYNDGSDTTIGTDNISNNNQAASGNIQTTMPEMTINQSKTYTATLHTDQGDIEIALDAKGTPITANNFVYLAKDGFYDNTVFHRAIDGFMIQGGDPTGTGSGGPGYKFDDEPFAGEYTRGTVAMANSGPNTNGSQFFIMHQDTPLPPNYVIFGHVTKGMETVDKIATAPATLGFDGAMSKPVNPVGLKSVDVNEE